MAIDGDRLFRDQAYQLILEDIFMENVKMTNGIINKLDKIPVKKLRRFIKGIVLSSTGTRIISKICLKRFMKSLLS